MLCAKAYRGQKRAVNSLKLESQAVEPVNMGSGNGTWVI